MDISRTACMALRIATERCPNPLDKIYLKKKTERGVNGGEGGVAFTPALSLYVRGLRRGREKFHEKKVGQ